MTTPKPLTSSAIVKYWPDGPSEPTSRYPTVVSVITVM
jgi:hypothetical protein